MNAPERLSDWTDANQRLLVAEFARLKQRLAGVDDTPARLEADAARACMTQPSAIDAISDAFGLGAFERDVLLLAAGVEMDGQMGALCAQVQGQVQRPWATFALALAMLRDPHWSALAPGWPLRRWRLLEIDDLTHGLALARLRIDERVLHCLAGINQMDSRLQPLVRRRVVSETMAPSQFDACTAVVSALQQQRAHPPAVLFDGDDAQGQADVAAKVAQTLGANLYAVRAADLPQTPTELDTLATLWQREAALLAASLLITDVADASATAVSGFVDRAGGLVFVSAGVTLACERVVTRRVVNKPDPAEQKQLWQHTLGPAASKAVVGTLDAIAAQFRFSAGDIVAQGECLRRAHGQGARIDEELQAACRTVARPALDQLAQRLEPCADWSSLVLPTAQAATLRDIAGQVRRRLQVCHEWGFAMGDARGLGVSALFAGESGTGKTLAAKLLAHELRLDLYRIDLSAVISKYIGETEKNLRRVFDAAEACGAILLFDEADALFGKRSEVKDSHDRYANIEVSYLLQRMEVYRGLAILTTNLKAALDTAFHRRLRFVVQFPFPDQSQREAIWRRAFPAAAPLHALDYAKLARLQVAGGDIRNIALNAAYLAAGEGQALGMPHLLRAAHAEAAKRERPMAEIETRGWA